jgi:nitrogen fixation NifU-like protein
MSDINRDALKDEYIDHMINPRNYGEIKNNSAKGVGKNPANNELVEIYLFMDEEIIKDIKFQAIGCMSTIVTGSIFTDIIKGESLTEALDVTEEFLERVKDAPMEERACAEMVAVAFKAARENYLNRLKGADESEHILEISNDCVVKSDE